LITLIIQKETEYSNETHSTE